MAQLGTVAPSLHCWQGDDVGGFENPAGEPNGGITATGKYPGKARTAAELRLVSATGAPVVLFRASQAAWIQPIDSKGRKGYVTDGPWLHRLPDGELLMLWSSFGVDGYTIGVARSPSGQLLGSWLQEPRPLYSCDGGYGMTFRDFAGNLWLSFHRPNRYPDERPMFLSLAADPWA